MRKLAPLTLLALALAAAPAAAEPSGQGLVTEEFSCGTVTHSEGVSAWLDGQHYLVDSFAFNGEVFKTYGNRSGITGEPVTCTLELPDGILTVTARPALG